MQLKCTILINSAVIKPGISSNTFKNFRKSRISIRKFDYFEKILLRLSYNASKQAKEAGQGSIYCFSKNRKTKTLDFIGLLHDFYSYVYITMLLYFSSPIISTLETKKLEVLDLFQDYLQPKTLAWINFNSTA